MNDTMARRRGPISRRNAMVLLGSGVLGACAAPPRIPYGPDDGVSTRLLGSDYRIRTDARTEDYPDDYAPRFRDGGRSHYLARVRRWGRRCLRGGRAGGLDRGGNPPDILGHQWCQHRRADRAAGRFSDPIRMVSCATSIPAAWPGVSAADPRSWRH